MPERGLCQFTGKPATAAKHAARNAEHRRPGESTIRENDHVRRSALDAAWSNSVRPLRNPVVGTKATRATVDRREVRLPLTSSIRHHTEVAM